jgi:APA family basic amino acid/polyamine antiporter
VTWTLVTAEVSYAMAQDDLFFPMFKKVDARHTARIGVLAAALLPSILLVWRYLNSSGLTVFVYLVNLSVVLVAIPYLFSASAQLYFLLRDRRPLQKSQLWRDVTLGVVGFLFSMWVTFASGYSAVYQAMVLILVGVPLYALLKNSGKRNSGVEDELAVGGDMALTGTKEEG